MAYLDLNNVFWASILILVLYMSIKYLWKTEGEEVKAEKKPSKVKSHTEKKPPATDASLYKTTQIDDMSVGGKEPVDIETETLVEELGFTEEIATEKESIHIEKEIIEGESVKTEKGISGEEKAIKDKGTVVEEAESKEETIADEGSTIDDSLITKKEPEQGADKPLLYVKKIIPEITLKPQDHSLDLLDKIIIKNSGSALAMIVKGSVEYKLKGETIANEPIGSNMALGPHQSITIENSFHLPLNEIQYIKIANIIKNKQPLEVKDVKPTMSLDIQYEGENGEVFDIIQNYQFDFKGNTWSLYTK